MVTHDSDNGAPVVYEENPTYDNMLGRVEYMSEMGTLVTDFNLIKPGSLHRANGGYLIVDAHRLLSNPFVWDGLKRALNASEIRIESAASALGLTSTVSLEPETVPLDVKVILLGSTQLYYLLQYYDPDFQELIRVPADFSEDMPWEEKEESTYAQLIATLIERQELQPFDRSAVSRMIEHSARMAGDTQKLSIRIRALTSILRESSYWASRNGRTVVTGEDVEQTVRSQFSRLNRSQERIQEGIRRNILLIDTAGTRVGQVNGLSVFQFGDHMFGAPTRITASTRMGNGNVVDIEREIEQGGPSHSKGVMILQGFVTQRYARKKPFSLSGSLVFEQTYGGVDGDSATCAELFCLLSSIAEVPLKQCFAVTGSMNQNGDVQVIGGVNEKIEAFFDVCRERGLDGSHGVLMPASNVQHLMLRSDVVEACREGKFHIFPLENVDQGIEILSGLSAGELDETGNFPKGSFNAILSEKLVETAELKRAFTKDESDSKS
jgi:lon-related putative ATP-dependent protease